METERFELFNSLISGIYRDIQKLKAKWTEPLGMKSVHIFWVYLLKNHPEGLSATELSQYSQTNRSLVSREIQELIDLGYVYAEQKNQTRRYGQKLRLTDSGEAAARRIAEATLDIQNQVSDGISETDLQVLYRTLGLLMERFHKLAEQPLEDE
jgi:DNA-binding MarR family transcriptional regulator